MLRRLRGAWLVGFGLVCARVAAHAAPPAASLAGTWSGEVEIAHPPQRGAAAAALAQSGNAVTGTLTVSTGDMAGTITVTGTVGRAKARLAGVLGTRRVRWKGRWSGATQAWRGTLVTRGRGSKARALLTLVVARDGPKAQCGAEYFASDVMPHVFAPICAQCHVPGGLAQGARFRVTAGDPAATAVSALALVDPADPPHSLILMKPRGEVSHGGGLRLAPGSVEEATLEHWVELVTAAGCGGTDPPPPGNLYLDNCASCHGADGRGVQGRPDIHCNRSIHDTVRSGRTGAVENMPAFPTLSDGDIATIQSLLIGLCPTATVTGVELFVGNCATCHGGDATGTPTAPSVRCATRVGDALRLGRGAAMPSFAVLVDLEATLIETYLDGLCTQHGRTGADLWGGNCAVCHGNAARGGQNALGVKGPDVHCHRAIADTVRAGNGDMPAFTALADADVSSIQQHLATLCPAETATGADLYTSNCAVCHGSDARGVGGRPSIRCNRGIHDPVRNGVTGPAGTMPAFGGMSDADIGLVQTYLVGLCPSGTASGADLYAGNCATCHAADAGGSGTAPSIRCATRVADAVQVGRGAAMPSFPALDGVDVTAVVGFLDQQCTLAGRTGADLFAGNCSSCHGATAAGGRSGLGVRGPDIRCTGAGDYVEKVRFGGDGMPAFPALGTADVSAIAAFVQGTYCTAP